MAKINLDNVRGITTFSVLADKEYENGLVVGLGDLVEGEVNVYEAVEATEDNLYLITSPEVHRDSKSASIDWVNAEGALMRVHQLERGDLFTVEKGIHGTGLTVGAKVGVSGNQFTGEGEVALVIEEGTIGADAKEAVTLRIL